MPPKKKKVPFEGKTLNATPLTFQAEAEHWNEYLLSDQTVLRLKVVLTDVSRLDNTYDSRGNPVYAFDHVLIPKTDPPDSLRKKDQS